MPPWLRAVAAAVPDITIIAIAIAIIQICADLPLVASAATTADDSSSSAVMPFNVLLVLPAKESQHDPFRLTLANARPVIDIAVDDVVRSGRLPDNWLNLTAHDSRLWDDPTLAERFATVGVVEAYTEKRLDAILGFADSYGLATVTKVSAGFGNGVPVLTTTGLTSMLSSRKNYPLLTRMQGSYLQLADSIYRLIGERDSAESLGGGYLHLAFFYHDKRRAVNRRPEPQQSAVHQHESAQEVMSSHCYFSLYAIKNYFAERSADFRHEWATSTPNLPFDEEIERTEDEVREWLQTVSTMANVIILCASPVTVREIMLAAHELGMAQSGEYVFINIDVSTGSHAERPWIRPTNPLLPVVHPSPPGSNKTALVYEERKPLSPQEEEEENKRAMVAYRALKTISLRRSDLDEYRQFEARVKERAEQRYNYKGLTGKEYEMNNFISAFYDAVLLYAIALNETIAAGEDPRNGHTITRRMWNRTFVGITGNVSIDANGDRYSDYALLDLDPDQGRFVEVAYYSGAENRLRNVSAFHWVGGHPPRDTPICGWDRSKCPSGYPLHFYLLVGCALLILVLALGFFIYYRRYQLEQALTAMSWKIDWTELEGADESIHRFNQKSVQDTEPPPTVASVKGVIVRKKREGTQSAATAAAIAAANEKEREKEREDEIKKQQASRLESVPIPMDVSSTSDIEPIIVDRLQLGSARSETDEEKQRRQATELEHLVAELGGDIPLELLTRPFRPRKETGSPPNSGSGEPPPAHHQLYALPGAPTPSSIRLETVDEVDPLKMPASVGLLVPVGQDQIAQSNHATTSAPSSLGSDEIRKLSRTSAGSSSRASSSLDQNRKWSKASSGVPTVAESNNSEDPVLPNHTKRKRRRRKETGGSTSFTPRLNGLRAVDDERGEEDEDEMEIDVDGDEDEEEEDEEEGDNDEVAGHFENETEDDVDEGLRTRSPSHASPRRILVNGLENQNHAQLHKNKRQKAVDTAVEEPLGLTTTSLMITPAATASGPSSSGKSPPPPLASVSASTVTRPRVRISVDGGSTRRAVRLETDASTEQQHDDDELSEIVVTPRTVQSARPSGSATGNHFAHHHHHHHNTTLDDAHEDQDTPLLHRTRSADKFRSCTPNGAPFASSLDSDAGPASAGGGGGGGGAIRVRLRSAGAGASRKISAIIDRKLSLFTRKRSSPTSDRSTDRSLANHHHHSQLDANLQRAAESGTVTPSILAAGGGAGNGSATGGGIWDTGSGGKTDVGSLLGFSWGVRKRRKHRDDDTASVKSGHSVETLQLNPDAQVFCTSAMYKGTLVALKRLNIDDRKTDKPLITRQMMVELNMLKNLQHDHITRYLGAVLESPNFYMVTEYCPKGSLEDVIENERIELDNMMTYSLLHDLVKGMYFLHHSEVRSHGRLKSTNCVIDSRFVLKITDFGVQSIRALESTFPSDRSEHAYHRGQLWTAPELLKLGDEAPRMGTQRGDVYSFAIILHEILYRKGVFYMGDDEDVSDPRDIVDQLRDGVQLRPSILDTFDEEANRAQLVRLMQQAWSENEVERPDFTAIRKTIRAMNKTNETSNLVDNLLKRMQQYATNLEGLVEERTREYLGEKQKVEDLLHQLLPPSVADQLISGRAVQAEQYDSVSIYFSDIVGFTALSSDSTPMEVVTLLNDLYMAFDRVVDHFDVYKVETIGDAYMVVSGLPVRTDDHASQIARMSIALLHRIKSFVIRHRPAQKLKLRIGIHSGSVVAGVVGSKMPRYCLFGDTVNTSSRMESNGLPLRIHTSSDTKQLLDAAGGFELKLRGAVPMKGKGYQTTYWLLRYQETWVPYCQDYMDEEPLRPDEENGHSPE